METSYKKLLLDLTAVPNISFFTGKNILSYMAAAEPQYPWVASLLDWRGQGDEEFISIGPNPAELANIGLEERSAKSTHVTKKTVAVFKDIVHAARRFLPSSFEAVLSNRQVVAKIMPDECYSGQNLQLNACKVVQLLDVFFSGRLHNPRRCRAMSKRRRLA